MTTEPRPRKQDADVLYEQYVKPLEQDHLGNYVAVSWQGQTVLAPTLLEAMQQATEKLGRGNTVVFKVGEKAVGRLR